MYKMYRSASALTVLLFSMLMTGRAQVAYQSTNGFKYLETVANTSDQSADLPVIIGFHYSSSTPQEAFGEYDQIK